MNKTWFIDFDGTIVEHNCKLFEGDYEANEIYVINVNCLLPGVLDFFRSLPQEDWIIITTARNSSFAFEVKKFLSEVGIKYNQIIFDLPTGPRVIINDCKPDGTKTAYAVNLERNAGIRDLELM